MDRPLTLPRHWRRNVGRLVDGRGSAGRPVTAAGVVAADDERRAAWRSTAAALGSAFAELGPGRVQVEFTRLAEL